MYDLQRSTVQLITFVMTDASGVEVTGLGGGGLDIELSKAGAAFQASTGAKGEIGDGWYSYVVAAGECDTVGPLSIRIQAAGCRQQNLEYIVVTRAIYSIEFTYTVTNQATGLPIAGVEVWVTLDLVGNVIVWNGTTDAAGAARDAYGALPRLDPGTWYFWCRKPGYTFSNPDTEVVS